MAVESKEIIDKRREEIMDACDKLYEERGFHDITIKDISVETSFSRPSIYNYFRSKEEIFLGLLTREYEEWNHSLLEIAEGNKTLNKDGLAKAIAKSLEKRKTMLKISAMNLYEIEENSRYELLVEYKKVFKESLEIFETCLKKYISDFSKSKRERIRYAFFPYMYGVYPYVYPSKKQKDAMDEVELEYSSVTIYQLTYQFLKLMFE